MPGGWPPGIAGRRRRSTFAAMVAIMVAACGSAHAEPSASSQLCTGYPGLPDEQQPTAMMAWVPGGSFTMGENEAWPEEQPAHPVTVSGFWIDRHEVTNAQFRRFVAATGYVTVAERGLTAEEHPELPPELRVPGGMVFAMPERIEDRTDIGQWWRFVPGADWRHPSGPGSSIKGKDNHPVVQVAVEDADAYARWLGRSLPTEAQWEFAARGGLDGVMYSWGDTYYDPVVGWAANTWQGGFPTQDAASDGFRGTAPVGCFPANGYGLFDMAGNVWEHTTDWYVPGHLAAASVDPPGPSPELAASFTDPLIGAQTVIKGGSWLCAPDFCARYRPAARQGQELGLGTNHVGFRTVRTGPSAPPGDGDAFGMREEP